MTNGEKIQTILDVDRDCTEVHGENGTMTFAVTQDFWDSEYKEPMPDKIRAEIKKSSHGKWYVGRLDGKTEEVLLLDEVLQIIDKYKGESEDT